MPGNISHSRKNKPSRDETHHFMCWLEKTKTKNKQQQRKQAPHRSWRWSQKTGQLRSDAPMPARTLKHYFFSSQIQNGICLIEFSNSSTALPSAPCQGLTPSPPPNRLPYLQMQTKAPHTILWRGVNTQVEKTDGEQRHAGITGTHSCA